MEYPKCIVSNHKEEYFRIQIVKRSLKGDYTVYTYTRILYVESL